MELLKRGGVVVFIDRKLENIIGCIAGDARPLLAADKQKLYILYNERIALYRRYADYTIDNNGDFGRVLHELLNIAAKLEG